MKQLRQYGLFFMLACAGCISVTAREKVNISKTTWTASQQIIVFEKPIRSFEIDCSIYVGDSIRSLEGSRIIQGSIVSWQWSFGDGSFVIDDNRNPSTIYRNFVFLIQSNDIVKTVFKETKTIFCQANN